MTACDGSPIPTGSPNSSATSCAPSATSWTPDVFGLTIDEQYGGLGESLLTYALVVESSPVAG